MTEVEDIIARDLLANEYKPAKPDQAVVLAEAAARRIVQALHAAGYTISMTGDSRPNRLVNP